MKSAIIYRGPSELDGKPIIVVATGLNASSNRKTGDMIQTWILRADMSPSDAVNSGADTSICGSCTHRGIILDGKNRKRSCYVLEFQAPASIYRSILRGNVPEITSEQDIEALGRARAVRLGSYGDPAAAPKWVWRALLKFANRHTGYTHQWREHPELRDYLMASCDSAGDRAAALALGWRTFRVRARGSDRLPGEAQCPASEEAGKILTCATCTGCNGMSRRRSNLSGITIIAHGSAARALHAQARVG